MTRDRAAARGATPDHHRMAPSERSRAEAARTDDLAGALVALAPALDAHLTAGGPDLAARRSIWRHALDDP